MRFLFLVLFLATTILPTEVFANTIKASSIPQVNSFIINMVNKYGFVKSELEVLFDNVELKIKPPKPKNNLANNNNKPTKKHHQISWKRFQKIFLTKQRITDGALFLQQNYDILQKAEDKYGVPKAIIVAILGIETNYGKKTGDYPTLKTLTALTFGKNPRQQFYKKELTEFLLLVRKNNLAPFKIYGSYAGAMGMAQFISSSYNYYAIDFNNDGKIDLFDKDDAIGSIANYFAKHYWQSGQRFALKADKKYKKFAKKTPNKPVFNNKKWQQKQVSIKNIASQDKFAFIDLDGQTWLTFWNFYVLTRYNHDNKYAMVAVKLAQLIVKEAAN